jgi:K+-transporting ATPase KdpF subunit
MSRSASDCEDALILDYVLGGGAALFLFGYLVCALLRPERF